MKHTNTTDASRFEAARAKWMKRPGDTRRTKHWLCEELGIGAGMPCTISARWGLGKSWLGMTLLAQAEAGLPLLGRYPLTPAAGTAGVELINLEMRAGGVQERWQMTYKALGLDLASANLGTWNRPPWRFDEQGSNVMLSQYLTHTLRGKRLAVIDPLSALYPRHDESFGNELDVMRFLTEVSNETGCALIVLRGNRASQDIGNTFTLRQVEGEESTVLMTQVKNPGLKWAPPTKLTFRDGHTHATALTRYGANQVALADERAAGRLDRYRDQIRLVFESYPKGTVISLGELMAHCNAPHGQLVEQVARKLEKSGFLVSARQGRRGEVAELWVMS